MIPFQTIGPGMTTRHRFGDGSEKLPDNFACGVVAPRLGGLTYGIISPCWMNRFPNGFDANPISCWNPPPN
jgi:hypothetical protein